MFQNISRPPNLVDRHEVGNNGVIINLSVMAENLINQIIIQFQDDGSYWMYGEKVMRGAAADNT